MDSISTTTGIHNIIAISGIDDIITGTTCYQGQTTVLIFL